MGVHAGRGPKGEGAMWLWGIGSMGSDTAVGGTWQGQQRRWGARGDRGANIGTKEGKGLPPPIAFLITVEGGRNLKYDPPNN